jgi:Tfp pilus assembly protein PilO
MKELFEKLTGREKATLGALAAAVLAVLAFLVFGSLGQKRAYERAGETLDVLTNAYTKSKDTLAAAVAEAGRWEDAGRDLEEIRTKYFYEDAQGIKPLRLDLERILRESGIRVAQIGYNYEDLEKGKVKRVVASFNFSGNYGSLKRFLSVVERFPRFLTVERIDFLNTASQTGTLELKIEIAGYYET